MPIKPQDLARLQSAALVLAHVAHYAAEPERAVLEALEVDPEAWDRLRDAALDQVADDLDAGVAFSRVFTRTQAELGARAVPLEALAAARRPTEPPLRAVEPPHTTLEPPPAEPTPARAAAPAPEEPARAVELPSFARAASAPSPPPAAFEPTLEVPRLVVAPPPAVALPPAATGKETGALDPEMIRKAALPFAGRRAEPPQPARPESGSAAGGSEGLRRPGSGSTDGDTLPVGAGAGPAVGPPTALTLRQYAELHAALSRGEATRGVLLLRAGLDEAAFAREDALWRQRLERDPISLAQFKALFSSRGGRA